MLDVLTHGLPALIAHPPLTSGGVVSTAQSTVNQVAYHDDFWREQPPVLTIRLDG